MVTIAITAAFFLYSAFMYARAYQSDDEKYTRVNEWPYLKPSSIFRTHTHSVLFVFPPAFGAVTAFLLYQYLGGEINYVSVFLLLVAIILGPYVLISKFNQHKRAFIKPSEPDQSDETAESTIFTRSPLSPEKYKLYRRQMIITCLCIAFAIISTAAINMVNKHKRKDFIDRSQALFTHELTAIGVAPTEVTPVAIDCRGGRTFIYTDAYLLGHCTTFVETTTKGLNLEITKQKLLRNSWQLTKEEDLGKKYHIWSKSADFQKPEFCLTLLENDGPDTTTVHASRGHSCKSY